MFKSVNSIVVFQSGLHAANFALLECSRDFESPIHGRGAHVGEIMPMVKMESPTFVSPKPACQREESVSD